MNKITVAVLFGGKAPEHEVSIITGIQVLNALDKNKYDVIPIYVNKEGRWFLGDDSFYKPETFRDQFQAVKNKKEVILIRGNNRTLITEVPGDFDLIKRPFRKEVDIFFPAFHGRYGEDGNIQGLFEMLGAVYVGCDTQASAIGMDKIVSKKVASSVNIPVLNDYWFYKTDWTEKRNRVIAEILKRLNFPVFIKPARLGSSIGVKKVKSKKELIEATEVALFYDTKVLVEKALESCKEINISIIGNSPFECSVCEQPISGKELLSFEDKYISDKGKSKGMATAKRLVPAPIRKETEDKIKEYAERFFSEIGGQGIARIDFLVTKDEKRIYLNEINTMPGSVAFYLWKAVGISFPKLVERLIELALARKIEKDKLISTFKSNILEGFKGAKGVKKF